MIKLKEFASTNDRNISARNLMSNLYRYIYNHKGESTYIDQINRITNPLLKSYKDTISVLCGYIAQLGTNIHGTLSISDAGTLLEHAIGEKNHNIDYNWINDKLILLD